MRRTITGLVAATFALGLTVLSAPAANAANAPEGCVKVQGTIICDDPAGQSDNNFTTTKKGSENSSHDAETTNPGGQTPAGLQQGL